MCTGECRHASMPIPLVLFSVLFSLWFWLDGVSLRCRTGLSWMGFHYMCMHQAKCVVSSLHLLPFPGAYGGEVGCLFACHLVPAINLQVMLVQPVMILTLPWICTVLLQATLWCFLCIGLLSWALYDMIARRDRELRHGQQTVSASSQSIMQNFFVGWTFAKLRAQRWFTLDMKGEREASPLCILY